MAVTVVGSGATSFTGSSAPVVSASWTPVADDLVVAWICFDAGGTFQDLSGSGWTMAVAQFAPADNSVNGAVYWHRVTSGEASGNTTSWTLTGALATIETGEVMTVVLRGVDITTPVDNTGTANQETTGATHSLAGLSTDNSADSLVLAGIFPDGTQTYTTPSGWTAVQTATGTNKGGGVFQRTALTSAGSAVTATNITASSGDEYISATLAFTAAAGGSSDGQLTGAAGCSSGGARDGAFTGSGVSVGASAGSSGQATSGATVGGATFVGSVGVGSGQAMVGAVTNAALFAGAAAAGSGQAPGGASAAEASATFTGTVAASSGQTLAGAFIAAAAMVGASAAGGGTACAGVLLTPDGILVGLVAVGAGRAQSSAWSAFGHIGLTVGAVHWQPTPLTPDANWSPSSQIGVPAWL